MHWSAWRRTCLIGTAAVIVACGGSDGGNGNNSTVSIARASNPNGEGQTAVVGSVLPQALRVVVREGADPVQGETVTWTALNGAVSAPSSVTDADGIAIVTWTLGPAAGAQTARATLTGAVGSPVTFNATAVADDPAAIQEVSGGAQIAVVNEDFAQLLRVRVTDQFSNPLAGITVDWAVQSGAGGVAAGSSISDATGEAPMTVTAGGTPGNLVIRASSAATLGVSVDFDLTVIAPPVEVEVGNVFFRSGANNTTNPAVDTVVAGQAARWTNFSGTHTVRSQGLPGFTSSGNIQAGGRYLVIFAAPGTYQYDCAIHGGLPGGMGGTIVVIP